MATSQSCRSQSGSFVQHEDFLNLGSGWLCCSRQHAGGLASNLRTPELLQKILCWSGASHALWVADAVQLACVATAATGLLIANDRRLHRRVDGIPFIVSRDEAAI
jgi:hypothetical protein